MATGRATNLQPPDWSTNTLLPMTYAVRVLLVDIKSVVVKIERDLIEE